MTSHEHGGKEPKPVIPELVLYEVVSAEAMESRIQHNLLVLEGETPPKELKDRVEELSQRARELAQAADEVIFK